MKKIIAVILMSGISTLAKAESTCIKNVAGIKAHSGWTEVTGTNNEIIEISKKTEAEKNSATVGVLAAQTAMQLNLSFCKTNHYGKGSGNIVDVEYSAEKIHVNTTDSNY